MNLCYIYILYKFVCVYSIIFFDNKMWRYNEGMLSFLCISVLGSRKCCYLREVLISFRNILGEEILFYFFDKIS